MRFHIKGRRNFETSTFPVPPLSDTQMLSLTHDARSDNCWAMVTFSTAMCIVGASVVFVDKLLPQQSGVPILERPSFVAASLALASGVMIFSSLSALLPASLQRIDPDFLTYICFFGGVGFTLVITRIVHCFAPKAVHSCGGSHDDDHSHTPSSLKAAKNDIQTLKDPADSPREHERLLRRQTWDLEYGARDTAYFDEIHHTHHSGSSLTATEAEEEDYFKLGIQTAIAIFVHKFPEGLIMFISSQASAKLGLSVCIAMSIHNFIEGFMIALPLYIATKSRSNAFWLAAGMGGLSQPLGAVIGLLMMNRVSKAGENTLFGIVFAGVSGMMTFISIQSMLPQAFKADPRRVPRYFFLGIFLVGLASLLQSL